MNTGTLPMYEWNTLPWRVIERQVFKLQKRIYQASRRGEVPLVHKLQRLLIASWSAKCLAVRRVTQDNRGKKTAGVDGRTALTSKQRLALANNLTLKAKARPLRRVWIPKPGSTEQRALGIPTIHDRALQALVTLALEPEWEAKFEPNSYGFRPGRACHDAIEAIFGSIKTKPKYVLDADIAKCFDRINHSALLHKLGTFPRLRRVIHAWLKAGVMDGGTLFPTDAGTPQGGVISPLLANIALHGFETAITSAFPPSCTVNGVRRYHWQPRVIRYADDLVILHQDLEVIETSKQLATEWLRDMGLELKPSKTKITHTLDEHAGNVGFDFLGFTIRQHRVGKGQWRTRIGRNAVHLDFKTIIRPSKTAIKRHYDALARVIDQYRSAPQVALISKLNPIIRGWSRYYATVVAKRSFSTLDSLVYKKLYRWAKRRHPHTGRRKVVRKYWHAQGTRRWVFATVDGNRLKQHAKMPIRRHVKVQGTRSPYNGDWVYWSARLGTDPLIPKRVTTLMKWQQGRCAWCRSPFKYGDVVEVDHIIPRSKGGRDVYLNLQLLHGHCHDRKSVQEGSESAEVPMTMAEVSRSRVRTKDSRTVLKTSYSGDWIA